MKTITLQLFATLFVLTAIILGCNRSSNKDNSDSSSIAEKLISNQDINPEIKKILYEFPTPFEVTAMLNEAKAAFIFDITNPVENLEKYITERSQALNLGVYSADLSYAATYNRSNEMVKLMECTGQLCDELGLSGIYNQNLIEQIKENAENRDSLVILLTNVFDKTKAYLSKSNRDQVTLFIAYGGFIETLYLAANLNLVTTNNEEITQIMLSQEENLGKLLNVIDAYPNNKDIESLKPNLIKIKELIVNNHIEKGKKLTAEKANEFKNQLEQTRNEFAK